LSASDGRFADIVRRWESLSQDRRQAIEAIATETTPDHLMHTVLAVACRSSGRDGAQG